MDEEKIKELIANIKTAKKYRAIDKEVIRSKILDYIKKNPGFGNYKEKFIIKEIKTSLHRAHGSFQFSFGAKKRSKYFEELKKDETNLNIIDDILETNKSTKERLEIYSELYGELFGITGKPNIICDLGCGINPVSFPYMNLVGNRKVKYYAYDVNEEDNAFLNEFFKVEKDRIDGKAELINLQNLSEFDRIPKCDICFMFKLLDVLEERGHKLSEEIIKKLIERCKFIIVSFSTRTIGGNRMNYADRGWIERMLERINLVFEKIEFDSEIFYVISK